MGWFRQLFAIIVLLMVSAFAFGTTIVGTGSAQQLNGELKITFPLSQQAQFNSFKLQNPNRLVVDIPNAQLRHKTTSLPISSGHVAGVRLGTQQGTDLRIVIDLRQMVPASAALTRGNSGYELVIIVGASGGQVQQELAASGQKVVSSREIQVARTVPKKNVLIVLDPGHGGKDPGALGSGGTREKDVVLQIAKILRDKINKEKGMRAVLTRETDKFIPLRERVLIARRQKADMFISLHADAGSATADGASVYILSTSGASSEAARLLARAENRSDLIGGVKISDKDDAIASMLLDISQDATIEASYALGRHLLQYLRRHANLHKKQVERAGFAVLKAPDIPSVLVETGFISNPKEEKNLRNRAHQARLADDILSGIKAYYKERPATELVYSKVVQRVESPKTEAIVQRPPTQSQPAPTPVRPKVPAEVVFPTLQLQSSSAQPRVEGLPQAETERRQEAIQLISEASDRRYITRQGDTLESIAQKFNVNLTALKRLNQLPDNQLRVPIGTTLIIP